MKLLHLKSTVLGFTLLTALAVTSCKDKPVEDKNLPPVVTTEGDTVHVDTAKVRVDSGKTHKPLIRKNAEDGGDSGL